MHQTVNAVYENGVLKPLQKVRLANHKKVLLEIIDAEDVPTHLLMQSAQKSRSYGFLSKRAEDIYSRKDGKPV